MVKTHRLLKTHRTIVLITILAFLSMSCFDGCAKRKEEPRTPAADAAGAAAGAATEAEPCDCPPGESDEAAVNEVTGAGAVRDAEEIADRMDRYRRAIERSAAEIPRETFDVGAVAETVGTEPAASFEWIRDNTGLVPYRGVLRGARGVLMDRLGNSLDRALLLAALLREAGHEARLARARLSREDAGRILDGWPRRSAQSVPADGPSLDEVLDEHARTFGLDRDELERSSLALSRNAPSPDPGVLAAASRQFDRLNAALGRARPGQERRAVERQAQAEALRDHWWVQVDGGSGWIDLDPGLPDMAPGKALAEAAETVPVDGVSEDLYHSVEIRVVTERWEDGRLVKTDVLKQAVRPFEAIGEALTLRHAPVDWPDDLTVFTGKDGREELKEAVLAVSEWLPVLQMGTRQVTASSFKDTGEINERPGRKGGGGVGGIAGGIFGALGGKEGDEPAEEDSVLTAEWIVYAVRGPGLPERVRERKVFDLIGPAARRAGKVDRVEATEARRLERGLALLSEFDIFLQAGHLSSPYLAHLVASRTLANWDAFRKIFLETKTVGQFFEAAEGLAALPGPAWGLALARREWSPVGEDLHIGSPNILVFVSGARADARGSLRFFRAFDIVENGLLASPSSSTDPFEARLRQGVLDTNAERFILSGPSAPADGPARIFEESEAQGIPWLAVRTERDQALERLDLPADTLALIKADLANGYVVVAPQREVLVAGQPASGWWRIDPETGQALGLSANGWGQAMTEHKLLWGFKVAGWTMCGIETVMTVEEVAAGGNPHPVTAVFLASCWALGLTSMTMAFTGTHGAAAWVVVIVEVQSFFLGMGVHLGMSQSSGGEH